MFTIKLLAEVKEDRGSMVTLTLRLDLFLQGGNLLRDLSLPRDLLELLWLGFLDLPGAELGLESLDITQFLLEVPQFFGRIRGDWLLSSARGPGLFCNGGRGQRGGQLRNTVGSYLNKIRLASSASDCVYCLTCD